MRLILATLKDILAAALMPFLMSAWYSMHWALVVSLSYGLVWTIFAWRRAYGTWSHRANYGRDYTTKLEKDHPAYVTFSMAYRNMYRSTESFEGGWRGYYMFAPSLRASVMLGNVLASCGRALRNLRKGSQKWLREN